MSDRLEPTRRTLLATLGAGTATAIAGCSGDERHPRRLDDPAARLDGRALHVADGPTDLDLPDGVRRVDDPSAADLVVLPADPAAARDRGPAALDGGAGVALVGGGASTALDALLAAVDGYRFGVERATSDVHVAAAVPRGGTLVTHAYRKRVPAVAALGRVAAPRSFDPAIDPPGRPTFDDDWTRLGRTRAAGRERAGAFVATTDAWLLRYDGVRRLAVRTRQAIRGADRPVTRVERAVDVANDRRTESWWPSAGSYDGVRVGVTGDLLAGTTRFEFAADPRPALVVASALTVDFRGGASLGYDASESYRYTTRGTLGHVGREHAYQSRTLRGEWFPVGRSP
ncbi:MAG: hypothetical protein ABEJ61_02335 [Haloferacaceae archaeon]